MRMLADLTHAIWSGMPTIPNLHHRSVALRKTSGLEREGIVRHELSLSCHTGTHMDAPSHFIAGGATIDAFPLEDMVQACAMVSARVGGRESIDEDVIPSSVPEQLTALCLHTGWHRRWGRSEYYHDHPYLMQSAAEKIRVLGIRLLLVDFPNVDAPDDHLYPVHKLLLGNSVWIVENVAHLDRISGSPFEVCVAPLPLRIAEASPVRVVARC